MSGCCERCGVYIISRPHPVALLVDGGVVWRKTLCVRCRDEIAPALLELARDLERPHSLRVAAAEPVDVA